MATQSFPFIRTRSMTQRLESATTDQGLIPPTASTRIPLSEALLNLERDGSPKKSTHFSDIAIGNFEIAPLKFDPVVARHVPYEDKENPFLAAPSPPPSAGATKKRKVPFDEQRRVDLEDSPKRIKVIPAVEPFPALREKDVEGEMSTQSDEGLGHVQRQIEFLSLKRARDSSPPPSPGVGSAGDQNLAVPDPNIDDASPRKRSRPSFLGPPPAATTTAKPDLPEMPHIDLSRPPPSPTRLRHPTSPTKFVGMPQLQKSSMARSPASGSLFAKAIEDRMEKGKGKEAAEVRSRPTFMGKVVAEPARPGVTAVTSPAAASIPITSIPDSSIDPALLALSSTSVSALPLADGQAELASPPRQPTPPVFTLVATMPEAVSSPPPTPLRALSPPGRLPSSRLPVRSARLRGPPSLASLAQAPIPSQQPPRHPMQTRAGSSRPVRAARKQAPPTAFRPPPKAPVIASKEDILAPIKDSDRMSRDVGTVGSSSRPSSSKMSSEAQTSLSNLSAALSKLSLPPPAPRSNSRLSFHAESEKGEGEKPAPQSSARSGPATARKAHVRKPSVPNVIQSITTSRKSASLAALANPVDVPMDVLMDVPIDQTNATSIISRMHAPLAGCVVFVDVRTKDGDDAGGVFVEMLKSMGARVLKSPTPSLTHLVLKSPLPHTITRYHTLPDPKPEVVAVGWVVKCAEENRRVEVSDWRLDLSAGAGIVSAIPGCSTRPSNRSLAGRGGTRRISMEPRRVELLDEGSLSHIAAPTLGIQERVDRAKRQSLLYQPKYSSPLRTNAYFASKADEEAEVEQELF